MAEFIKAAVVLIPYGFFCYFLGMKAGKKHALADLEVPAVPGPTE